MSRAKTNLIPFPQRRDARPLPDGTIVAEMKRAMLAAVNDSENSAGEEELLKIASPEDLPTLPPVGTSRAQAAREERPDHPSSVVAVTVSTGSVVRSPSFAVNAAARS